jgi:hypothetical protein
MKQGREASGPCERLADPSRGSNGSCGSKIRREGTNPEDGTGEDLADLAFRGSAPKASPVATGRPEVVVFQEQEA